MDPLPRQGTCGTGCAVKRFRRAVAWHEAEIKAFCRDNYHIGFPMTAKQKLIGGHAHSFYRCVVEEFGEAAAPKMELPQVSNRFGRHARRDAAIQDLAPSPAITDTIEALIAG